MVSKNQSMVYTMCTQQLNKFDEMPKLQYEHQFKPLSTSDRMKAQMRPKNKGNFKRNGGRWWQIQWVALRRRPSAQRNQTETGIVSMGFFSLLLFHRLRHIDRFIWHSKESPWEPIGAHCLPMDFPTTSHLAASISIPSFYHRLLLFIDQIGWDLSQNLLIDLSKKSGPVCKR